MANTHQEQATQPQEHVTGLRIVARNNYTCKNEQHLIIDPTSVSSLVDVAVMLDSCADEATERCGYSGTGAGARLEVVFNDDDPDDEEVDGEEIDSLDSPLLTSLPLGDPVVLRQFISSQRRSTVWNGQNHIARCVEHSTGLLARIRSANPVQPVPPGRLRRRPGMARLGQGGGA